MAKSSTAATTGTTTSCCTPFQADEILDDRAAATLAAAFASLADPTRLRLLSLLASADTGEVCVCDLTGPVGKSQPTVSHHLKLLTEAGLVIGDKRGRWVWYRIVPDRLTDLRTALTLA